MTNPVESEILTRVGPGSMMGNLMRQYWVPAALSSELVADGPPVRLMLLGEKLIGFRDSAGRIGIIDQRCPHRCASLFFGRNEEGGLRCLYHGWKFDVTGRCLDMPNLPEHQRPLDRIVAKAYPALERAGLVWAYLGPRRIPPPLPQIEATLLASEQANCLAVQRECNWLQGLEGEIDTSHLGFLHLGSARPEDLPADYDTRYSLIDRAPQYRVAERDWGTMYASYRAASPGNTYWRFSHFMFPFWSIPPEGSFATHLLARAWVPMDDTHTMFFHLSWNGRSDPRLVGKTGEPLPGAAFKFEFQPNTTDWYGRWRLKHTAANDYGLDRAARKDGSFSGIDGIHLQDQAITESMGPITDHASEHLVASDQMIVRTRRRLVAAAKSLADEATVPPGVDDPEIFLGARGGDVIAPSEVDWVSVYARQLREAVNPTGRLEAAE
jgi:phthalate 4,5-dioxygenase